MKPGRGSARILIAGVIGVVWIPLAQAGEPTFTKHVVVAQEAHAADVGRNVLRAGGNAIDAAVATAFALAVTVPEAGNLGGEDSSWPTWPIAARSSRSISGRPRRGRRRPACTATVTASRGRATAPGPGPRGCPGRSAAWAWPMPGGASLPGPIWSSRLRGWPARAFPSRPTWPARSTVN